MNHHTDGYRDATATRVPEEIVPSCKHSTRSKGNSPLFTLLDMQPLTYNSRIQILKMPFVAFKHLIENFDFHEIINLSTLSKRLKALIKCSIRRNKYKLGVHFDIYPKITLKLGEVECCFNFIRPPICYRNRLPLDETVINAIKSQATNLSFTFNSDIDFLTMLSDDCFGHVPSIVDWINENQSSINGCKFYGYRAENYDILYFIQNCKVKRQLALGIDSDTYSIPQLHPRFDSDVVSLIGSREIPWVTLEDVSYFDCIEIGLGRFRSFSEKDLNSFLKCWIQGSNSRMKYFGVYVPYFKPEAIFEGIHVEKREESLVRHYEREPYGRFELKGGNDIESKHGKLATVHQESEHFVNEIGETFTRHFCEFRIIVWN
ncbi:unnamed protein product [Caenorhabditis brenneri]